MLLAAGALAVTVVGRTDYAAAIPEAQKRIEQRDPDDVELLALALSFDIPVWSIDNDFEDAGVKRLTTEKLLQQLGMAGAP